MTNVTNTEAMLFKTCLRWAGQVSRMEDNRLPTIVLNGELSTGHRDKGEPRKRYKDTLKRSLTPCNIDQSVFPLNDIREIQRWLLHLLRVQHMEGFFCC